MVPEKRFTRRTALKSIVLISGGLCIAALGVRSFISSSDKQSPTQSSAVRIKVVYLGMSSQTGGIKQEYLTFTSPPYLNDVLAKIKEEHTNFSLMISRMQVVVNGVPTQDNPKLSDNTEVDLIPVYPGG
jgi:molybdopterin converting factor small subunit